MRNAVLAALVLLPAVAHAELKKTAIEARHAPVKAASQPLTIDGMLDKINNSYMQGLQRCYVKGLARNPSIGGKVTVIYTVNQWGHVSGTATGIAPTVDACLTSQIGGWRFPSPRDAKGALTEASFKIALMLNRQ